MMHQALRQESWGQTPRHRSRKRRIAWITTGVVTLGSLIAMAVPIIQGKTEYPEFTLATSVLAVQQARDANVERWVPELMADAERTLRSAQLETRLQHAKLLPFRDYTFARTLLEQTKEKATKAVIDGSAVREEARASSEGARDQAQQLLGTTIEFAKAMHLNAYDRSLIQKARILLDQASILHQEGEYIEAVDAAREAGEKALRVGDRAVGLAARYTDATLVRKWRGWIDETIGWSRRTGSPAVIVNKEKHVVTLYDNGVAVKTYRGELGYNSIQDKHYGGDNATPEGRYHVTSKKGLGQSRYHKALLISYPNEDDRREFDRMRKAGQIPNRVGMGSLIEIHGDGGRGRDWTNGCVALTNRDMDDLFARVGVGTPITIVGGDGSGGIYTDLIKGREKSKLAKPESDGNQ